MCTNPPNRSTHPPNFNVSIGQVSFPEGGHGFLAPGDGFPITGGTGSTGGMGTLGRGTTGGMGTEGMGTAGIGTTGGMGTTGGTLMGMGGRVMGPLGDFEPEPGFVFLGGLPLHEPQPRMGEAEEMKSMQMRKRE